MVDPEVGRARRSFSATAARVVLVLGLTALLMYLFVRGTDLRAVSRAIGNADRRLILAGVVVTLLTYAVRAWRWQVLLAPLGRPGWWNCFQTTVIGFMANFLTGRLGEIVRPVLLARRESFPVPATFATIVLERVFDLVSVVFLVGVALAFGEPLAGAQQIDALSGLRFWGGVAFAAGCAALAAMFATARYPGATLQIVGRILGFLPERFAVPIVRLTSTFIDGLRVLVDGGNLLRTVVLSLVLWLNLALSLWLGARAFGVEFAYTSSFLVQGFLVVGVAVPTPGAIGSYHLLAKLALTMLFGTSELIAAAVAVVIHAISFVPVTLLGVIFSAGAGLNLRQVKDMSRSE